MVQKENTVTALSVKYVTAWDLDIINKQKPVKPVGTTVFYFWYYWPLMFMTISIHVFDITFTLPFTLEQETRGSFKTSNDSRAETVKFCFTESVCLSFCSSVCLRLSPDVSWYEDICPARGLKASEAVDPSGYHFVCWWQAGYWIRQA